MIEVDIELIKNIIKKGKRIDNRDFEKYREIIIEQGIISSAEGSAKVKIGDTEVIAGVKMDVGEPYPDSPDEGVITVSAEFVPLASPEFEAGPPGEDAIELARVVDRAIRESKAIDFKKLCITPKEKVWMIFVDLDILNDDGNLIDASGLATIVALLNTRIPELTEDGKPNYEKRVEKLPINGIPISTTFVKIDNTIIADPNLAESKSMNARLTVGTVDKDDKIMICSLQKGGPDGLSMEDIDKIIDLSIKKGEEFRNLIRSL
ncbi:MAG: exosome complex protein Rrp42 [Candidatus Aenigmatarchaeota archaeon]